MRRLQPIAPMKSEILTSIVVVALSASCALGAVGCATPDTVHTATSPGVDLSRYHTFSIGAAEAPPAGYQDSPSTQEIRRRIVPLVEAALVRRGYVEVPASGDLTIRLGAGRRRVVIHEASGVATNWQPDDEDSDVLQGAIIVDALDGPSGHQVWHGADRVERDHGVVDEKQLERSVTNLIGRFPPATGPG